LRTLLNQSAAYRVIWNDSAFDEQVAAASAARTHPLLIQSQYVRVRRQRASFAHLAEHVNARGELARQFIEDIAKRRIAAPRERAVRNLSELDVVVDVDEAAREAVGKEPGDEEWEIPDFAKAIALAAAARLQRARETNPERLVGSARRGSRCTNPVSRFTR
jgi:hypothetical protein